MSQIVTLEIRDDLYAVLSNQAEIAGIPLSEWITVTLEQQNDLLERTKNKVEKEAARQRFRHHAGSIDLGYPTGADNQSIDTDLIQAYGDGLS
jgi:hypothetical protein